MQSDIIDENGVEQESLGQDFCTNLVGGTWKQTSYNANFRGNYAGKGFTYFVDQDLFMPPKEHTSWVMATAEATWKAPITEPTLTQEEINARKFYSWDEDAYQADTNDPKTAGWLD